MRTKAGAVHELDLDSLIQRLLAARSWKVADIAEADIRLVCMVARDIFYKQPMLLELEAPLKIAGKNVENVRIFCSNQPMYTRIAMIYQQFVGDIHGQYPDLLRLFDMCGHPPQSNYLFLGDYVDRGKQSLETIILLMCYKIKYPTNFFLLRGNHEVANLNRIYGFYDECKRRYSTKLWKCFQDVFNCLPVAALIDNKIFCCHGGLSPNLRSLEQLKRIPRPAEVQETGLLCDILWSDPDPNTLGWGPNERGVSYVFGPDVLGSFLQKMDLDIIVRGHQVVEDGYEFFGRRGLVTVFSAPNYCGEFDNAGAVMTVDENLLCSFQININYFEILKPVIYGTNNTNKTTITGVGTTGLTNGMNMMIRLPQIEIVSKSKRFRRGMI